MTTEIELKYLLPATNGKNNTVADDITAMLEKSHVSFEVAQNQLTNDYYDSDHLSLRKIDFGLRIRTKGEQYEQTIKTAGKVVGCLHQRPEYNINLDRNELNLSLFDEDIWPENTDVSTLEQELNIIFSTNFLRKTWLIHQGDNVIELALDRGEIFTTLSEPRLVINELEIELVSGDEQALFVLAKQLMAVVSMTPGKLSKAARGYTLYHDKIKNALT